MDKKLQLTAITICTVALALVGSTIDADAAAYLKLGDIKGEATDSEHKDWIDVLSFEQSMRKSGEGATGATRQRGDVIMDDIVVVKELDKSSPKLAESIAMGTVIPKVEFELTSSAGTYYKYELTNVMVTSYSVSGTADERPTEQVSLNFEEIKTTYTEYGSDGKKGGNVETSWKVEEGTK